MKEQCTDAKTKPVKHWTKRDIRPQVSNWYVKGEKSLVSSSGYNELYNEYGIDVDGLSDRIDLEQYYPD